MSSPQAAKADQPAPDVVSLWDYFQAFCEARRVSIELRDAHREICNVYQDAICGAFPGIEYILTSMPRRIGKTKIGEATGSWTFGEFTAAQMLYGTYAEPLVKRSVRYMSATMRTAWYIDLYGDLVHSKSSSLITTVDGGTLYGAGSNASVVGFGAGMKEAAGGFIFFDDPAKPDEALSKVSSAAVIQNFETTWKGCRNSDRFTPFIINAQRLGPDDLIGYIERNYPGKFIKLKFPCFVSGVSQFPDTWSDSTMVDLLKTRIGRFVLASQFQQEPISLGGNLIMTEKFVPYDPSEAQSIVWEQLVITVDTALKAKEQNDFSCFQLWGRAVRRAYLIDQVWGKWESPELLSVGTAFWFKCAETYGTSPLRMVIEEKAAGTGLIQQLNVAGIPAEGIERDIDKVRRVQAIMTYIETGLVYIPAPEKCDANHFVHGFLAECAEFKPDLTHAHDDRVDAMSDGVKLTLGDAASILDLLGVAPRS